MRKNCFVFLFAAMVLLAGCAKEETAAPIGDAQSLTVTLSQTKTHLGEREGSGPYTYKIYWSNGDKISVNGAESAALTGLAGTERTATFDFASSLGSAPYNILYPSSIYDDATHVTLPAVQTYKADGFADGMFPMAGYTADGSNITINHLCAVIKLSVKRASGASADTDNLVSVTFKGKNNEQVSGSFTIDYGAATLTGASSAEADKSVKVVKTLATATDAAAVYYVVVPAQTYSNGFDIIIQDAGGDIMTQSKASSISLVAGKLYSTPEIVFVPTGEADPTLTIDSAADLIAFATDYNNKVYEGQDDLVVALSGDIAFDAMSSAAFNATGGIGTPSGGDNYFNGLFDGNNNTISGLVATVPLFGGIGDNGKVKDLTIDNTCSFEFTRPTTESKYYGAVTGYHKGLLDGVTVSADVSLAAVSDVEAETALGGFLGRMAGKGIVDGCSFSGGVSVPSGFATKTNDVNIYVGGIAGYTQSTTTLIKNSHMLGTIDYAGVNTAPASNSTVPYLRIGGIIGQNNGTITNCDTECLDDDVDGAISYGATDGNTYYATIVNHSTGIHCLAEGGIVGYNYGGGTVSSCTNRAKIITNIAASGTNDEINMKTRYFRIGGIAGMNVSASTSVTGSNNYGEIVNGSTARLQSCGGVVGWNSGVVNSCTNYSSGTVSFITTGTKVSTDGDIDVRSPYVGGVIGENSSASVSDVHNNANLSISCIEKDVTNYVVEFGGVIGHNTGAIDGGSTTKNITNSGTVYATFSVAGASSNGIQLGGIVGYSTASVSYAVNSGYVHFSGTSGTTVMKFIYLGGIVGRMGGSGSITGCTNKTDGGANDGEVYFHFDNNATKHSDNYAGGILGYSSAGVEISGCTNGGYIHGGNGGTAKASATCFVGGIVAYLEGAGSSISSCTNNGNVNNHHRNNTNTTKSNSTYTGGIAGEVIGTDENRITISNCTVSPSKYVVSHRGYVGGVVGYAEYADITSCSHDKNFTTADGSSSYFAGGIVGWITNCTLTSCNWTGTTIQTSQLQTNGAGGIAAKMDGGTLNGCSSSATTIKLSDAAATGGALVGIASNTPTIKNCHYKTTINGAAATVTASGNYSDGGGNVAE